MDVVILYVLALVAVAAALGVILQRSAVRSALFLLVNFCSLAGLYILLNAQFVAIVQIIIYAGAVVVLFLFVVMLLGMERAVEPGRAGDSPGAAGPSRHGRLGRLQAVAAGLLGALFLAGLVWAFVPDLDAQLPPDRIATASAPGASWTRIIGAALATDYAIPFELASLVLLIAIIGAVVLARRRWEG